MAIPSFLGRIRTLLGGGHDVFLSHSHADGGIYARQLEALLSPRYLVFRDESTLAPGESLPEHLAQHAARSSVFLLIGTCGAYESSWVTQEISAYLDAHKEPRLLRIVFPGVSIPGKHLHHDFLANTLGIESRTPATRPPEVGVLKGIERHFDVVRQRVRRRLVTLALLTSLVGAGLLVRSALSVRERDTRVERWLSRAQRAEESRRYESAEWALANAWWQSDRSRNDLRESYSRARERRMFDRLEFHSDPDEFAHAIADGTEGPLVVTQQVGRPSLEIRMGAASSSIQLADPDDVFDIVLRDGWLLVQCSEQVWIQPAQVGAAGQWLAGLGALSSVLLREDKVVFLLHEEDGLALRTYRLSDLGDPEETSIDLPPDAVITTSELLDDGTLFLAGDQGGSGSGWIPTVWIRRPASDQWIEHPFERELSLVPQCYHADVGSAGKVACLALSPIDFSASGAPTPARQLYTRLDDDFGLAWFVHSGYWIPELVEPGPIDVVFRTESGDLKWLEQPSVILTQVEPRTLASDVSTFLVWTSPTDGPPVLIVAKKDGHLDVLKQGTLWTRTTLPSGPVRIMTDEHHTLLLADTVEGIRLWRVSEAWNGTIPDLATLQRQLPPEATTPGGSDGSAQVPAPSERGPETRW